MQFVPNGPDVPAALLQAHEDGRVVFFCGAGISYPAKLPGFRDLVVKVYKHLEVSREGPEVVAFREKRYDSTLGFLSERVGKEAVRREVARILMPKKFPKAALTTHQALLTLARDESDESGKTRLITTNFDRLFEEVIKTEGWKVRTYSAPLLPIPKASKWNGLVYLHGLLPEALDDDSLLHLVMTSGDFGLAYLTERWAARFASELFRNFVVCFVGYSIADPILRYMMDALAADRSMGEGMNKAYAFGCFEGDHEAGERQSWREKGVIPILYKIRTGKKSHDALHKSLEAWAATYRDGVSGREQLIARYAVNSPAGSTVDDNFAGRILWAVSHPSGLPARFFAKLDPVPPLSWLQEFEKNCYEYHDLPLFKVSPDKKLDEKLRFSLIQRPTPYSLGEYMSLFQRPGWNNWDNVMTELARWLTRHMDNRNVILWAVGGHGRIHPNWSTIIANHLKKIDDLIVRKAAGEVEAEKKMQRLLENAPSSILSPFMRSLWRAAIGGRVCTRNRIELFDTVTWLRETKLFGLTATLRFELKNMLCPKIEISKSVEWKDKIFEGNYDSAISPGKSLDWEIVVALKYPWRTLVDDIQQKEPWCSFLPMLLTEFTMLLRDALDLMQELGGAGYELGQAHIAQASIGEHPQNRRFNDWTVLIELTRDAWLATLKGNPHIARGIALSWWDVPFATFKRIALFAATEAHDKILDAQAIDWLLSDGARWLWENVSLYEVIRVLVVVAPRTSDEINSRLQRTILKGPPSDQVRPDVESQRLAMKSEHSIWLRLAKMAAVKQFLLPEVSIFLASMQDTYPNWKLSRDDRDEFAFWMGSSDIGAAEDEEISGQRLEPLPSGRMEIVEWLRKYPDRRQDGWRKRCSEDFAATAGALSDLANDGEWFQGRWHEALQAWTEPQLISQSWQEMASLVVRAADSFVIELSWPIAHWLVEVASKFEIHEDIFISLLARLLNLADTGDMSSADQVESSLIGQVTNSYFRWWYRKGPRDAQGLDSPFRDLFSRIADTTIEKFRHGRVFLAKNAVALFRVDEKWAREHLLGLFDWDTSPIEAVSAWKGFLSTPQLYWPFLSAVESAFLATANHYEELGSHGQQYVDLLTFAALDGFEFIAAGKLKSATRALPLEGLIHVADTLVRALEGSGNKTQAFWKERVVPYLRRVWPANARLWPYLDQITESNARQSIAESMARLSIVAGNAFPQALDLVKPWLMLLQSSDYPVHLLSISELAAKNPLEALRLLVAIVDVGAGWAPSELRTCLDVIAKAAPNLKNTTDFKSLDEFARRRNQ